MASTADQSQCSPFKWAERLLALVRSTVIVPYGNYLGRSSPLPRNPPASTVHGSEWVSGVARDHTYFCGTPESACGHALRIAGELFAFLAIEPASGVVHIFRMSFLIEIAASLRGKKASAP